MVKTPKVLVYIPVHNYVQYTRECLDSVINQTYPEQRIVVSLNACTDGTDEIVKKEYPQAEIIEYKEFKQGNPGINEALRMVDCDFYTQLMMDDKLAPNFWEETLPFFDDGKVGVVSIGAYQFNDQDPEGSYLRPTYLNNKVELLECNKILITSPVRKAAWEEVGFYITDEKELPIFGDWDFWIRLILVKDWKWVILEKPMFYLRRHLSSQSYNYDFSLRGLAHIAMGKKWGELALKYHVPSSYLYGILLDEKNRPSEN